MGSPSAPKTATPNYSKITKASEANAKTAANVAKQELDMQKQQYDYLKSLYGQSQPQINQAVQANLDLANIDKNMAQTANGAYAETLPALKQYTQNAETWASPARRAELMGRAAGTAAQAQDQARQNTMRDLE